jgi:lysophospholipase L1-like esterase
MSKSPGSAGGLPPRGHRALIAATIIAAVTLFVLEVLLRAFDPLGVKYFTEADRYFRAMRPDNRFAYIHPALYKGRFEGVDVSINSHGFRAPEWQVMKPTGVYRLMILGDSVVFGWGAPQDSIFPARLQHKYAAEGRAVEVIAAGVGSWNTRTEYEYLKAAGFGFEPDAILLVVTNNDVVPDLVGRTEVEKSLLAADQAEVSGMRGLPARAWRAAGKRSFVLSHVQYFLRKKSEASRSSVVVPDSPRWRDAEAALGGIIEACRVRRIQLVACLYTCDSMIAGDAVLSLYRRRLEAAGIPFFTVPEAVLRDGRYRNSFVDGHANSRGHRLIAERVYGEMASLVTWSLEGISGSGGKQ